MRECPICGNLLQDGYCLYCGYDLYTGESPSRLDPLYEDHKDETKDSFGTSSIDNFDNYGVEADESFTDSAIALLLLNDDL